MNNYHVIIPCAGHGSRFESDLPKQYHQILNLTVLDWTLRSFLSCSQISTISVVHSSGDTNILPFVTRYPQINFIPCGGSTRAETVLNGLKLLDVLNNDWILVHDAARCCIRVEDIDNLINEVADSNVGGILASMATDTIKMVDNNSFIVSTIDRNKIFLAQTPQMFRYDVLLNSIKSADLTTITDEASAIEQAGLPVKIVKAKYPNLKVTYPHDLLVATSILSQNI